MSLGKKIVKARKRAGLTQAALAKRIHKNRSSVNEYELGRHEPRLSILKKIARACGSSLEELLA